MAVPTAPAAGEPIAEAWGDVVHDGIVAMDIQVGTVPISLVSAGVGSATVTFPRPFAAPPIVLASCASTNLSYFTNVGAVTATQATLTMTTKSGANATDTRNTNWLAYGPRA